MLRQTIYATGLLALTDRKACPLPFGSERSIYLSLSLPLSLSLSLRIMVQCAMRLVIFSAHPYRLDSHGDENRIPLGKSTLLVYTYTMAGVLTQLAWGKTLLCIEGGL